MNNYCYLFTYLFALAPPILLIDALKMFREGKKLPTATKFLRCFLPSSIHTLAHHQTVYFVHLFERKKKQEMSQDITRN